MTVRAYFRVISIFLSLIFLLLLYLYFYFLDAPQARVSVPDGMRVIYSIYGYGDAKKQQLNKPTDIAVDAEGNLYVTDTGNSRILVFEPGGSKLKRSFGFPGPYKGHLLAPVGVDVDQEKKRVYVTDRARNMLLIYDTHGTFLKEILIDTPLIPLVARGKLYLTTHSSVKILDLEGKILQSWGRRGRAPGEFDFPNGIAIGENGDAYISDLNNLRIQVLNKKGEVKNVRGKPAESLMETNREFGLPAGLALDDRERIVLVDSFHNNIRVIDKKDGKDLASFGDFGYDEGQFYYPMGIEYLGGSRFAIADKYNDRIQVVNLRF